MKVDVLLGLQWGDEGKGKIVDVLTPTYDVIARFQGGPNAGHTLEFEGLKHVLHIIPSGIFHKDKINIIGGGVVLDPVIFKQEIDQLDKMGYDLRKTLRISKKAHLITPTHRILDAASEASKGKSAIGSTLKGIGPTYMDKTGRNGLRIGDIISGSFQEKFDAQKEKHFNLLKQYDFEYDETEYQAKWMEGIELLREFSLIDSEHEMNGYMKSGKTILAEGAQGTLLDVDFGSYPFVTSSTTVAAGACTGLGIAPNKVGEVFGIFKAYCTRVGGGSFPTELFDQTGENLAKFGHEFGSTTGRARRCGWLDIPALKYAIMVNGVTQLFMTKADVLDSFETVKVATAYEIDGETVTEFPYDINVELTPVYKEFKGWKTDITKMTSCDELPQELKEYIEYIEKEVEVPIKIVSVGPDRSATLFR